MRHHSFMATKETLWEIGIITVKHPAYFSDSCLAISGSFQLWSQSCMDAGLMMLMACPLLSGISGKFHRNNSNCNRRSGSVEGLRFVQYWKHAIFRCIRQMFWTPFFPHSYGAMLKVIQHYQWSWILHQCNRDNFLLCFKYKTYQGIFS